MVKHLAMVMAQFTQNRQACKSGENAPANLQVYATNNKYK